MHYDSLYPTFCPGAQAGNGLGQRLRQDHPAAMPCSERDSIIGHGRRSKQAHDEHHDWIGVRRGRCPGCGKTFTFLPLFSLPYTHYSLLARGQALCRRFVEHCSWEAAAPTLKDSNRVPDPSTLRRWSSGLDR
jgi:hypothetical protein